GGVAGERGEVEADEAPALDGVRDRLVERPRRAAGLDEPAAVRHLRLGDEAEESVAEVGAGVEVVKGEVAGAEVVELELDVGEGGLGLEAGAGDGEGAAEAGRLLGVVEEPGKVHVVGAP